MNGIVRFALATHLHTDLDAVRGPLRLAADLKLTPLDLVWVAMRVESLSSKSGTFPVESLRDVVTVADLVAAFQCWIDDDIANAAE